MQRVDPGLRQEILSILEGANDMTIATTREATAAIRRLVDGPSEILIEWCRSCLADPPPSDWMPISVLESKG